MHANVKKLPFLAHLISVEKADSAFVVELFPEVLDDETNFVLLASFEKIPMFKKYDLGIMAKDLEWNSKGGMKNRKVSICRK